MRKNQKTIAVLTALSTMFTTAGCTIDIDEKKALEKLGEFGITVRQDNENAEINIAETTLPIVTTTNNNFITEETTVTKTYDAQVTSLTTASTTLKQTTPVTTENEQPVTRVTPEPRLTIPTKYTTVATASTTTVPTTTVAVPDIISNLNFIDREESHELQFVTINVSNKYIAKASGGSTISGAGEGMYWPANLYRKVSGKSEEEALTEIRKLNSGSEDYILAGKTINVPFTTYYCSGKSVYEVSEKTGIDVNKIIELNRIDNIKEVSEKENDYLVMITKEKQDFYTNREGANMAILDNGLVVTADIKSKINDSTYLTFHKISENQNAVNRVYVNGKTATITPFAYNVASINNNGIICSNDTKICLFNTMAVYTNGTYTLVSIGQLPSSPAGYELVGHKEYDSRQKELSLYK